MSNLSIEEINNYLREGKRVKEIREILGYSEKVYQNNIKMLGYKYNQLKLVIQLVI